MQIIIVGCGKVGRTLAEQLQEEESDITLIDVFPDLFSFIGNHLSFRRMACKAVGKLFPHSKHKTNQKYL